MYTFGMVISIAIVTNSDRTILSNLLNTFTSSINNLCKFHAQCALSWCSTSLLAIQSWIDHIVQKALRKDATFERAI